MPVNHDALVTAQDDDKLRTLLGGNTALRLKRVLFPAPELRFTVKHLYKNHYNMSLLLSIHQVFESLFI
jgi:hypothetical protein